ncbi:MAG: MtrB/PioB family outer membrane beta-barrel protein [Nitrospirota bacterium]
MNESSFNGTQYKQNYSFALTSKPLSFLNAKIFYNYYDSEDRSERITQTVETATDSTTVTSRTFDYTKNSAGIELGLRLPANLYLIPAYKYVKTDRSREDLPQTEDNIYSIDLRWTGLSFMTVNAGYERLQRGADHERVIVATGDPGDQTVADGIEPFLRRYDVGPQERDTYRASVELYPMESLNLGLGYQFKRSDYENTVFGLRNDERYEFNVDADYTIGKFMRLFAYFDYERVRLYQFQRQIPFGTTTNLGPFDAQTSTRFNWNVTQIDKSYDYGVAADIYIIPRKLTLQLQYNSVDSDGEADYTYLFAPALSVGGSLRTNENIDINNWDDYRKNYFIAKAIYNMTKSLSLSAGYAYERFRYDDVQVDGYQYTFSGNFLTGANNDLSYSANVVFATAAYRF